MSEAAAVGPSTPGLSPSAAARLIALLLPLALLGGAFGSQYFGGLHPCEMCYWQRWPHGAAILFAVLAFTAPADSSRARNLTLLAALAITISGIIGVCVICFSISAVLRPLGRAEQVVKPGKIFASTPAW